MAIQVAAELGNRDMLPLAREIVVSRHAIPFRMSAMATIGILGSSSDLDLLKLYTSSSDMRLRLSRTRLVRLLQKQRIKRAHLTPSLPLNPLTFAEPEQQNTAMSTIGINKTNTKTAHNQGRSFVAAKIPPKKDSFCNLGEREWSNDKTHTL